MEIRSRHYADFRKGKQVRSEEGAGEDEIQGQREHDEEQEEEGEKAKRSSSARGWDLIGDDRHLQILEQLKSEYYGSGAEEGDEGGGGNSYDGVASGEENEANFDEAADEDALATGESEDDYGNSADDSALYDANYMSDEQQYAADLQNGTHLRVSKDEVSRRRVVAGTVSGYKHKRELQETLERKAALKYIRERKEDVSRRARVLHEAEDKVAVIKSHIDEIDSKMEQMKCGPCLYSCVLSVKSCVC